MPERRYSRWKQHDVLAQLAQLQTRLGIELHGVSRASNSVFLSYGGEEHHAVVLARSSDWYYYSLNSERFKHDLTMVVCGTHDSCINLPVLALDIMRLYEPLEMRVKSLEPTPKRDQDGRPMDAFERWRKSHYGHNMLIGALMQKREDALHRLQTLPPSTRLRIEAQVRRLHMRRRGRPLFL
jgi:hypothetical protein